MVGRKQLGEHERFVIGLMLEKNESASKISQFLGYSRQTISREIKRNSINGVYNSERAQHMYVLRKEYPRQEHKFAKLTDESIKFIYDELKKRSSP